MSLHVLVGNDPFSEPLSPAPCMPAIFIPGDSAVAAGLCMLMNLKLLTLSGCVYCYSSLYKSDSLSVFKIKSDLRSFGLFDGRPFRIGVTYVSYCMYSLGSFSDTLSIMLPGFALTLFLYNV